MEDIIISPGVRMERISQVSYRVGCMLEKVRAL